MKLRAFSVELEFMGLSGVEKLRALIKFEMFLIPRKLLEFAKALSSVSRKFQTDMCKNEVITCRAAVAWEAKKPLVIEEVQVAPPRVNEVRIRIVANGVCHTDLSALNGLILHAKFPSILGHEGAGIVESVGECVTGFKTGDHVIPLFVPQCNECVACKSNRTNCCLKTRVNQFKGLMNDGTRRFTCRGKELFHFLGVSSFSEFCVVPDVALCKINDQAPLDKVCLLGCGVSTGYGAALKTARVMPGSTCSVWGLGGIGLATAMGCKKAGAARIYGIDINPEKFELAKKFGVTHFVNPKEVADQGPIQDYLIKLTDGGFDYAFEAVGNVNIMRTAFESTREGWGTTVIIGVAADNQTISTDPLHLVLGRRLKGTFFGGWKSVSEIPLLVEDYMKKELLLDEFITHTMPLEKINEALDLMREGKGIRSVIIF